MVWKTRHEILYQFLFYMLVGCLTSIIDFIAFAIFNFWVFVPFRDQTITWWLIDYTIESGGLTAFLAFATSYGIAQTFDFFMQRRTTFKANNNVASSAIMYAIMIIGVYFLQLYLPTLTRAPIVRIIGETYGDIVAKCINMTTSMLIQFPLSKWVVMRRT